MTQPNIEEILRARADKLGALAQIAGIVIQAHYRPNYLLVNLEHKRSVGAWCKVGASDLYRYEVRWYSALIGKRFHPGFAQRVWANGYHAASQSFSFDGLLGLLKVGLEAIENNTAFELDRCTIIDMNGAKLS